MKNTHHLGSALAGAGLAALVLLVSSAALEEQEAVELEHAAKVKVVEVEYLEIVTPDVDATCAALTKLHGVSFSEPEAGFGYARTAKLEGGGLLGVRAPMRADEEPVVRPYLLVEDIEAAVATAEESGAEIAHPPLEIPGHGKFAIYILGGVQYGLWQD